jgi:hypothetical protein
MMVLVIDVLITFHSIHSAVELEAGRAARTAVLSKDEIAAVKVRTNLQSE